jgi:hypothetical protein
MTEGWMDIAVAVTACVTYPSRKWTPRAMVRFTVCTVVDVFATGKLVFGVFTDEEEL